MTTSTDIPAPDGVRTPRGVPAPADAPAATGTGPVTAGTATAAHTTAVHPAAGPVDGAAGRSGGGSGPLSEAEAAVLISDARQRIDALDDRIIALVRERVDVSARIQQARITTGGRRVHLSREMEILGRFRAELGRPGTSLAMTLLELSRGRI